VSPKLFDPLPVPLHELAQPSGPGIFNRCCSLARKFFLNEHVAFIKVEVRPETYKIVVMTSSLNRPFQNWTSSRNNSSRGVSTRIVIEGDRGHG
jgi:hypothetical protein